MSDTFLDRFVTFTASTSCTDKLVKLLGYSFSTIAQAVRYHNGGKNTEFSEGMDKIYGGLSMARIVFRMQGSLESVWEVRHASCAEGWEDSAIKKLARLQGLSNIFYYVLEDVAFFGSLAPRLVPVDQSWWWARSDWAWLAYCMIDVYMNIIKSRELRRKEEGIRRKLRDCSENEVSSLLEKLSEIAVKKRTLALQHWRMLFYIPNAVHWAFYRPPMHPGIVAVLGLAEAIVGAKQAFPPSKAPVGIETSSPM